MEAHKGFYTAQPIPSRLRCLVSSSGQTTTGPDLQASSWLPVAFATELLFRTKGKFGYFNFVYYFPRLRFNLSRGERSVWFQSCFKVIFSLRNMRLAPVLYFVWLVPLFGTANSRLGFNRPSAPALPFRNACDSNLECLEFISTMSMRGILS